MKKIVLMLMLCLGFISLQAQTVTFPAMPNGLTYQYFGTDYTITNTTARTLVFSAAQPNPTTQDLVIKLDSVSGNHTSVAVALYGQKSAIKGDWTQIGSTVTWWGRIGYNPDTTIIISNTTANRYRNYKAVVTGVGTGVSKVADTEFKQHLE